MTGRLVTQKGLDLILGARELLGSDAQFVFLGSGDPRYEHALIELATSAPNRIGVQLDFTDRQEHRLMAGADIFLMPSLYEPCGLTQMRAQRYGAPPIVRRVGGLADTVEDGVTGFAFDGYSAEAFQEAGFRALRGYADSPRWQVMVRRAMARDFSWERSVDQYLEVYRRGIAHASMR
jgi:starch synthase